MTNIDDLKMGFRHSITIGSFYLYILFFSLRLLASVSLDRSGGFCLSLLPCPAQVQLMEESSPQRGKTLCFVFRCPDTTCVRVIVLKLCYSCKWTWVFWSSGDFVLLKKKKYQKKQFVAMGKDQTFFWFPAIKVFIVSSVLHTSTS